MRFMELVIARDDWRFAPLVFVSIRQIFSANSASNFLDSTLFCVESRLDSREWFRFANCECLVLWCVLYVVGGGG